MTGYVYSLPDHSQILAPDGAFIPASEENADYIALRDAGVEIADYAPPAAVPPRSVAMWRARTIMKVTPHGTGTLFDAVQSFIAGMSDPLQKASAEEALERGDVFDRDGVFVPMIAAGIGIDEPTLDNLMTQAAALPA